MTKNTIVRSSLVEQVLDKMFTTLEGRVEFDNLTVQRLKELAANGDLSKAKREEDAIKSEPGETSLGCLN